MDTKSSSTAVVTSDIASRLAKAVEKGTKGAESSQVAEVQVKIEELKREGLLRRQQYSAATTADFQRLYKVN